MPSSRAEASTYADKILVTDGSSFGTAPMSLESADTIRELDGVAAVDAQIQLLWDLEASVSFSIPDMVIGAIPGADEGHEQFQLELATGRMLTAGGRGQPRRARLGRWPAQYDVTAGDTIEIRGHDVRGDRNAAAHADRARHHRHRAAQRSAGAVHRDAPTADHRSVEPEELVNQIVVYPDAEARRR